MSDDTERRPASVYTHGAEPDPRFSLANERTFLAWVRTCLGIIAGAVAMHSLGVPDTTWLRKVLVVGMLICAGVIAVGASFRWARTEKAMRLGLPLPGFGFTGAIAAGICLVAAALAVAFALL